MNLDYSHKGNLIKYTFSILVIWLTGFLSFYFFVDQALLQFIGAPEKEPLRLQMREITNVGLASHYFIITVVVYLFCRFFGPRYLKMNHHQKHLLYFRYWSKRFFLALCTSGLLNLVLKIIFSRQRPHLSSIFNASVWKFFSFDWNFQSFPSGHTQVMFCVATMLGYAWPKYRYFFISFAGLIGFTRIGTLYHFPSDVLTGAVIGHLATLWTLYFFDKNKDVLRIDKMQSHTVIHE